MTEAKKDAWSDVSLVPVRRCAVCGREFTPRSKTALYCSLQCREENQRQRSREYRARHPKAVERPRRNARVDSYCPFREDVADEINRMRGEHGR